MRRIRGGGGGNNDFLYAVSVDGTIVAAARRGNARVQEVSGRSARSFNSRPSLWPKRTGQWSGGGSNSQPSHCERDALPIELPPQRVNHYRSGSAIPSSRIENGLFARRTVRPFTAPRV